jgi:hypothetical protein
MDAKNSIVVLVMLLLPLSNCTGSHTTYLSKYAGQESRDIKSLSQSDIEELRKGQGWGLAKAAELNGMPGPAHVLEMKDEIALDAKQAAEMEQLYIRMKRAAVPLGKELIQHERRLNRHFAHATMTDALLHELLGQIARVRKELRYVHLSTHLKTPEILTAEQISLYNRLRGYTTGDPCNHIPKGHDPQMWKRHHNCP